jgi:lipopolysaccharide/colanic/teichoic acid biosynthesis glycosyltransferase
VPHLREPAPRGTPEISPLANLPAVEFELSRRPVFLGLQVSRAAKRALDVGVTLLLLPVAILIMVAAAVAIRLTSPGPVIFRQQRTGEGGREFTMFKLRTMRPDAEQYLEALMATELTPSVFFKPQNDCRVTPVGRFLRKFSVDELPQLFNVLRGEMSLVGPRPLLRADLKNFPFATYARRFAVKPGLTGLWQVSGRSLCAEEERLRLDVEYVERWSFGLDLLILARTPLVVFTARGAV